MIDKFGKEISVGDEIVTWLETGCGSGTSLQIVKVEKITERFVFFAYTRKNYRRYHWEKPTDNLTGKRTSEQFILLDSIIK